MEYRLLRTLASIAFVLVASGVVQAQQFQRLMEDKRTFPPSASVPAELPAPGPMEPQAPACTVGIPLPGTVQRDGS